MLLELIKNLIDKEHNQQTNGYLINLIKEFLQNIVLEYLYSQKGLGKQLVFTGGTCLRFCFGLPRLSEDLDFDCAERLSHEAIALDLKNYFAQQLGYSQVDFTVKGKERKIYLKFPLLKELNLRFKQSFLLLLKIEIALSSFESANMETSIIEKNGRHYFLRRYSLPDLMAGKIHAFLTRLFFKGRNNEIDFKGRDMFDLVWYMGRNVRPNLPRLAFLFKGTKYEAMPWPEMLEEIRLKARNVPHSHLSIDLANFLEKSVMLDNFLNNYLDVIEQYCQANHI